ncbi:Cof-type HAD-IIB family hydrolase [Mesomycoplasma lagogenitalium]|uniref:Cof-type HAD-IIB family hydrolase n=1 Tax=Mesomycoplasma lagogenitalium TaxID=171286 RepID=A0ABY8LVX8_9BACT|nr:Cof-type HAD-IIB family hydrolase [Mesomycoplasma lagogenitalium]WGI36386.1 Cof-type HAD-IIB family hydrolase [Mesomycoplasma lagogenitalium]
MKNKEKKFLFVLDLDGTVLSNSATGEIHQDTLDAIKLAKSLGHVVCIVTGRPWRSTKPIYDKLELNTVVGNYNGAHIHNPSDEFFIPQIHYLNLNEMLYILGDKKVKKEISNIAIEGPGWVQLKKRDEALEKVFGFNDTPKFTVGLNLNRLPLKPTGIVFDVKPTTDVYALKTYLDRRYGDLGEFSSWSKGEGLTPVFDITTVGVNKAKVVSLLMRYYHVETDHTICIGDGYNDAPMFRVANVAVAMGNSDQRVKKLATVVLKKTNKEGGVGFYIKKFLKNPLKEIEKSRKIRESRDGKEAEIT